MKVFFFSITALIAFSMTSCGGGSDSGGSDAATWTVDGTRQYARKSSTQDAPLPKTPSTVVYPHGDCDEVPRSDYQRCSIISFEGHRDMRPGEYPVNPNPSSGVSRTEIGVRLSYGTRSSAADPYHQSYAASSGRVRLSVRGDGNYVFDLIGSVPMRKVPSGRNPEQPLDHAPNTISVNGEGLY